MDAQPPAESSPATPHAPSELKPVSGLAITAFVLSFVCGFVSLVGPWMATLLPIVLAAAALFFIAKTGKRGRLLAIFAILVAGAFGFGSYVLHTKGKEVFAAVPRGVLSTLSDDALDPAAKDEALAAWAFPDALEADPALPSSWRKAYEQLVAEVGPWKGGIEYGDHVPGFTALVVPPPHGDEIRPASDAPPPAPGGGIWVKVPFEKETLWLCVAMGTGQEDARRAVQGFKEDAASPVVGAVRWFRLP